MAELKGLSLKFRPVNAVVRSDRTLLRRILREQWGFQGYVVSDCGAVDDIYGGHHVAETAAKGAALSKQRAELDEKLAAAEEEWLAAQADLEEAEA